MNKQDAVASLGQASLLQPARVRAALKANDRLKLYLTLLQAAAGHAAAPERAPLDLAREIAAADIQPREQAAWLRELPASASLQGEALHLPELPRLALRLHDDLGQMARPLLDDADTEPALARRVAHWQAQLARLTGPDLDTRLLSALTHGKRGHDDSLHLLVMDLHKALNHLAARLTVETIAGAHVWQLADDGSDAPRVAAFMHGVNRTRALKFDHPGLDTAATRDGTRLLIQNDIGTNDAHVLVLQVEGLQITLTYSDLHRQRFAFFQALLAEVGAAWSGLEDRTTPGLNAGAAYHVGTASFGAQDTAEQARQLEGIGARIVFLIDWNRARKRLLAFVGRDDAVAVLRQAAQREAGHMAWLRAGGERLVWNAMAAQGEGAFHLGDRLDDVLGAGAARDWLVELMVLANQALQRQQPPALVADEARLTLARRLMGRLSEFELLEEHAGLCHALAQGLRDGLAHGVERDAAAAERLSTRAKAWERQADQLVMRARARAERQPQWAPFARLIERSDDVADALEEAAFVLSLVAEDHHHGWGHAVRNNLQALADAVLTATQDHVKALAVASHLGEASEAADHDEFLDASWRVLQAERQCDELLRSTRRALAREVKDAASLLLGNELAAALEQASDGLLALGYGLREHAFRRVGAPA
ncbi:MAG: DUF47 family protein [Burkholderiales bacterium]|nr:DUF47 family protein [Burkholderiales bacterium]